MEKKPEWLKVRYNREAVEEVARLMKDLRLNTVCREANCPNLGECFRRHTATFMILGAHCTRNCRFCNVSCAQPEAVDENEPERVAEAAARLGLRHVVVTSVTRDDLPDGGAAHFASVIRALRRGCPGATVEVLIPDLRMNTDALDTVLAASPDVLGHNVETVKSLYAAVRPQAVYERSLAVLRYCKERRPDVFVKTGFMVGLGETEEEIDALMDDILETGCDILTIGQYLQPGADYAPLRRYVTPREFEDYREKALQKGFKYCASTPLVRSSYRAAEAFEAAGRRA